MPPAHDQRDAASVALHSTPLHSDSSRRDVRHGTLRGLEPALLFLLRRHQRHCIHVPRTCTRNRDRSSYDCPGVLDDILPTVEIEMGEMVRTSVGECSASSLYWAGETLLAAILSG